MMAKKVIGAVTIGQAPRHDVVDEMLDVLGPEYEVRQAGALDGLNREEIEALRPVGDDYRLVTRLADGREVQLAERLVTPLLQAQVKRLFDEGLPLVMLLCTGAFPPFQTKGRLVRPQELLYNATQELAEGRRLGVVCPAEEQVEQAKRTWRERVGMESVVRAASPYHSEEEVAQAARELKVEGVEVVALDCMGYTRSMQARVREITGALVLLPRTLMAAVVRGMMG
jgi:protein AroM